MAFYMGQKVVCVDDANFRNPHLKHLIVDGYPRCGTVYTIRGVTLGGCILLRELRGLPHSWATHFGEGGWLPERFRPVVERKTDISIFTKILDDAKREREAVHY